MDAARRWLTVLLTGASLFVGSWMFFQFLLGGKESSSLALAGMVLTLALTPLAAWGQGSLGGAPATDAPSGSVPPRTQWRRFATINIVNLIVLVWFASMWLPGSISPPKSVSVAPNVAPNQSGGSGIGSMAASPLTELVTPAPRRQTISLAGQQSAAMGYSMFPKGCPNSVLVLEVPLNARFSTITAALTLDDRAAEAVRTSLVITLDGVAQEEGVLSAQNGKTLDVDVRGKNRLSLTLETLGRSEDVCSNAEYFLALNGQALE